MKKVAFILIIIGVVIVIGCCLQSCGGEQKASEREDVWYVDTVSVIKVPFQRTGGDLIEIQVSLNGVPMNMWWDSGASTSCISALELLQLAKQGRITLDDYQREVATRIADGSTSYNMMFNIKELYIEAKDNKHLILNNIDVLVSPNEGAPLLLGQNVMMNLPKYVINDAEGVIEFEEQ